MKNRVGRISLSVGFVFLTAALGSLSARAQDGVDKLYKSKCAMCHAVDGSGNTPAGKKFEAKDLRSPEVQKQTDAQLTEFIAKGKGKMQAYNGKLTADEIKRLVAYVRELAKKK